MSLMDRLILFVVEELMSLKHIGTDRSSTGWRRGRGRGWTEVGFPAAEQAGRRTLPLPELAH